MTDHLDDEAGDVDRSLVVVDKPAGPTSHEVAAWVRDIVGVDRAAHTGTLDPVVTGCLPVLLGKAARASGVLSGRNKSYVFVLQLHEDVAAERLDTALAEFESEVYQRPPVQGSASRGLRTRRVHRLERLESRGRRALCEVDCEAGTYVRKLCHDVGLALGVGAHMQELRRTRSGEFDVEDAVYLQDVADAVARDDGTLDRYLVPVERALETLPHVEARPSAAASVSRGSPLYPPGAVGDVDLEPGETVVVSLDGVAVCVGETAVYDGGVGVQPRHVLVDPAG
ncbi:MAG: RNA-guided pseudouridylation complex pseudouridine synthase subunit Cbf5 [Halobacteriota archaeon]